MVYLQSDYIITPLGEGIDTNLKAIVEGHTRLQSHNVVHGEELVTPVMASLLDESRYQIEGYSLFESLCIHAIKGAMHGIEVNQEHCVFILSSTKGDIWCSMADTATHIATYFDNHNSPIVVSTACTSGVAAQIVARRAIESGRYDTAIVVGTDIQREFIVSGFQSFQALSENPCRPFDKARDGLNAGEAAACMIVSNQPVGLGWTLLGGSIHNDANHISGPSRTGEGSWRCIEDMLQCVRKDELACISVHGTGTPYNDEMESIALHRAEVNGLPVTALKGIYGHTMGAAGLLETILSLHALAKGMVLPSHGYSEQGTTYAVNLNKEVRSTSKTSLIKLLSGFGGVNAAVAWTIDSRVEERAVNSVEYETIAEVTIEADTNANITDIYKQKVGDYPKFYKMDSLCQLGFLGVELAKRQLKERGCGTELDSEKTAIIFANTMASIKNDTDYQSTIADKANYYPSPALFVYTLPNIITGELAIRHRIYGETACYVLSGETEMDRIVQMTLSDTDANNAIIGWVECTHPKDYYAHIQIVSKK